MTKQIKSSAAFQELLAQDKPVLVDFYADWCGPCQIQLPVIDQIAAKHAGELEVVKVNVDDQPDLAQAYGVRSIPALFLLRGQDILDRMVGYQSEQVLEERLAAAAITA